MTWASVILALLQLARSLLSWTREKDLLKAGQDQAIAKASLEVLEITKTGRELRERIAAMDDAAAEELWRKMIDGG